MKTILLFMPYGSVGGMERLALHFYNHYKSIGYNVIAVKIIGLDNDIINFGEDEIILSKKDFSHYSKRERIGFYFKIPKLLKNIINNNKVNYTISFGDMANCFSALSKTNEVKIASIHALKSVELSHFSIMGELFKFSYKTIYKRFNKVVCISKGIKVDLIKNLNYKFDNLQVIYNPHDINSIVQKSEEPILDTKEHNIFNKNVILFVGRLSLQKSPWHLINAFYLSECKENYNLVFIGDGDTSIYELLQKQIKLLEIKDKVIFLGRKENPYKYMKAANIVALSSMYEGTPNVIAEAIAIAKPFISSNCTDGIIEMMSYKEITNKDDLYITESGIITPNFFKGNLYTPNSFNFTNEERKFAEGLNYFVENRELIECNLKNSRLNLLEKYNLNQVCKNYLDV